MYSHLSPKEVDLLRYPDILYYRWIYLKTGETGIGMVHCELGKGQAIVEQWNQALPNLWKYEALDVK